MFQINSEYKKIVDEKKFILNLQIKKAIYSMIESRLLWYELYVSILKELGFKLYPYGMFVANKTINGKQ